MYSNNQNYPYDRRNSRLPAPKPPRSNTKFRIAGLFVCVFLMFAVAKSFAASDTTAPDSNKGNAAATAPVEPPKRTVDTSTLAASINQISKQYPYNTSVAIVDLNSDKLIQTGDTYPFIAASTTKLLTAMVYLTEVEAGKASLSTTIDGKKAKEQLRLMINESDNTAWKSLNDELTKDAIAAYAHSHGVASYDPVDNKVTAQDMAKFIAKFYKRQLVNDEHTKLILSWMQNTSEERFIPSAVPASINTYHKAGYLADRVHDVGIIDNGETPFVLVIYSKSYTASYDYLKGQKLYKQITDQALATFK